MNKRIVVFDFDKTLTYKDTLFGFYLSLSHYDLRSFCNVIRYLLLVLLYKFNLIDNSTLKYYGFHYFIRGKSEIELTKAATKYASKIKFNALYQSFNFLADDLSVVIISASYQIYLRPLFPHQVKVYGSNFSFNQGKAYQFRVNCYAEVKREILNSNGILNIDTFYTDSISDYCLASMSKKIRLVNKDNIIDFSNIEDFRLYFVTNSRWKRFVSLLRSMLKK